MSNHSGTKPLLQIIGSNNEERSITITINGVRYNYYFHGAPEEVLHSLKKIMLRSHGRGILFLNSNSRKVERLSPVTTEGG